MRWTEIGLRALCDAGLSPAEAARTFRPLFLYAFGHAAFNARDGGAGLQRRLHAQLLTLPPDEYPLAVAGSVALAASVVGEAAYHDGLELLLDGIEARAARVRRGVPPRGGD